MKLVSCVILHSRRAELAERKHWCSTDEDVPGRTEGTTGLLFTSLSPLHHNKTEFPCALSLSAVKDSHTEIATAQNQVPPLRVVIQRLDSPVASFDLKSVLKAILLPLLQERYQSIVKYS